MLTHSYTITLLKVCIEKFFSVHRSVPCNEVALVGHLVMLTSRKVILENRISSFELHTIEDLDAINYQMVSFMSACYEK